MTTRHPGDFGRGQGELDPCSVVFALRRAAELREKREAVKRARIERRRAWFARLRMRLT